MIYLKKKKTKWFKKALWSANYPLGVPKAFGKAFFNHNLLLSK